MEQQNPGLTEQNIEKNNRKYAGADAQLKEKKHEIDEGVEKDIERKESIENLINIKFEELKIEKGFKDLESMNPLSMNIEQICNFPANLPVISGKRLDQEASSLPAPSKEMEKLTKGITANGASA